MRRRWSKHRPDAPDPVGFLPLTTRIVLIFLLLAAGLLMVVGLVFRHRARQSLEEAALEPAGEGTGLGRRTAPTLLDRSRRSRHRDSLAEAPRPSHV
jgi:hypothetical protein